MFPNSFYGMRRVHEQMVNEAMKQARIAAEVRGKGAKPKRSLLSLIRFRKAPLQKPNHTSEGCSCLTNCSAQISSSM